MAAKTEVPITGSVLTWARVEAGYTMAEFAARLKVSPVTVARWEREEERPGQTEFAKILQAVRRPSALFYMPEPPKSAALPTSFRQSPGERHHRVSPAALREIRKARRIQEVVRWTLAGDEGAPVALERLDWKAVDPTEAGVRVRARLNLGIAEQGSWKDESTALREWRTMYDDLGILVFALQLGKADIRGFSAWDEYAPLIAVNTAYTASARIFTMAHEFAHLLTRSDSACFDWINPRNEPDSQLERWCEKFAAALILPPRGLRAFVVQVFGVSEKTKVSDFATTQKIARKLKVSIRAAAISLVDAGLGVPDLYRIVDSEASQLDFPKRSGGGGGMPVVDKRLGQYGVRVPRTLFAAVGNGRIGRIDVADYLDLSMGDLEDLSSVVGERWFKAVG